MRRVCSPAGRSVSSAKNVGWRPDRSCGGGRRRVVDGVGHAVGRPDAGGLSCAANGRRQAGSERHLAGAERRELRHRGAHGASRDGAAAGPVRPGAGGAGARARRGRRGAAGHGRRRRRRDSRTSRKRSPRRKENQENWLERDPEIKCYLPGVPRANYMPYPFQILQSQSAIFFAYEYAGAVRNIYLKDPGPAPVDSWMGQSVGRWEGDTLVIEATGFNDSTWFDRAGNFHSEALKVVERYTRTGAGRHLATKRRSKIRTCSRGRGRSACRSIGGSRRTSSSWTSSASSSSRS